MDDSAIQSPAPYIGSEGKIQNKSQMRQRSEMSKFLPNLVLRTLQ
jgi:hypothetical protein